MSSTTEVALRPLPTRRPLSAHVVVLPWLAAVILLCWCWVLVHGNGIGPGDLGVLPATVADEAPPLPWRALDLLPVFTMWAALVPAVLLPPAAPAVLLFFRMNWMYHGARHPWLGTLLFVAGCLGAWAGFAAVATLLQWALHDGGVMDGYKSLTSATAGGLLLVAAGAYQWTPVKHACLHHCRSPLAFMLTGWQRGVTGAFRMGFAHGSYCSGSCWLLLALLFVAGTGNLPAIIALAALVVAEKLLPGGPLLACVAGLALVAWGTLLLFP